MSPDPALVDTKVLVYAHYRQSPQHGASKALLDQALTPGAALHVAPQNLSEFYAVVTNPKRVTHPLSATEALDSIDEILAFPGMKLVGVPLDLVSRWTKLIRQMPIAGRRVFDAQLVATMQGNGLGTIYTYNTADFILYPGITALEPPTPSATSIP